MTEVWVVTKLLDGGDFEINGVYSTREKALSQCGYNETAVRMELDRNHSADTEFLIAHPSNPAGCVVSSSAR